jgi:uncharacterized protein with HEPN domain
MRSTCSDGGAARSCHLLEQMLEAIADIEQIMARRSFEAYAADRPTRRAVERCIEIVSEASRRLPPNLKDRHPAIPWQKIAGIGNVLRHDYDVVNDATIWHAATADLLPLKAAVAALLREVEAGP